MRALYRKKYLKKLSMVFSIAVLTTTTSVYAADAGASSASPVAPRYLAAAAPTSEQGANSQKLPTQILKTGVNVNTTTVSSNSKQLATSLKLTPLLERIQTLKGKIDPINFEPTNENIATSQQLTAATVQAMQVIDQTNLAIDFVQAEIAAEQNLYNEILSTFTGQRDKAVLKTNALSFISNGALWAVGEALDIPTNTHPNYSVSSGTLGILAGIIPTIASMYALKQLDGKKETSERAPNMLSKLFNYPTNVDIEYPKPVWDFLNSAPVDDKEQRSRKDQLIDRWVSDNNIPNFTDRQSKKQLDVITGSIPQKNGLSIATLNARQAMLQQLGAEVTKMKRMLYELSMIVSGEKQL
ncbi:MAG: hypothetical protein P4L53_02615 [Candidatus Obscuribacterales bacterium]|nr:hypothetical protein [Candidatus Obscuribacterales bacterium]